MTPCHKCGSTTNECFNPIDCRARPNRGWSTTDIRRFTDKNGNVHPYFLEARKKHKCLCGSGLDDGLCTNCWPM
jgi:hypothetical protein